MEPFTIRMGRGWGYGAFQNSNGWELGVWSLSKFKWGGSWGYGALQIQMGGVGVWSPLKFKWVGVRGMEHFEIQMGGDLGYGALYDSNGWGLYQI